MWVLWILLVVILIAVCEEFRNVTLVLLIYGGGSILFIWTLNWLFS